MPSDLTDRQQAILDFVRGRIATDGLPPTWAEIATAFGFRQTRAAQKHLQALEAKGHLQLLPGKARVWRKPKARAISAQVGGRPSAAMRSRTKSRMACWRGVRSVVMVLILVPIRTWKCARSTFNGLHVALHATGEPRLDRWTDASCYFSTKARS